MAKSANKSELKKIISKETAEIKKIQERINMPEWKAYKGAGLIPQNILKDLNK